MVKEFIRDFFDGNPLNQRSRIVDEDVDTPKCIDSVINQAMTLRRVHYICMKQVSLSTSGFDIF